MTLPEVMVDDASREFEDMCFRDWLHTGVTAGWIAMPDCMTHNAVPMRTPEEEEFEDGFDPCIIVMRLWKDGYE